MVSRRKRHRAKTLINEANKRPILPYSSNVPVNVVQQSLLSQFYPEVLTLREYLLVKLPSNSRVRRKKVLSVGRRGLVHDDRDIPTTVNADGILGSFLDSTLVGIPHHSPQGDQRVARWHSFTNQADASELEETTTLLDLGHSQSEVRLVERFYLVATAKECFRSLTLLYGCSLITAQRKPALANTFSAKDSAKFYLQAAWILIVQSAD